MAEVNTNGKVELYFKEIFGLIKDKAKELLFIQIIQDFKVIGEMTLKMNNLYTMNHLSKLKLYIKLDIFNIKN